MSTSGTTAFSAKATPQSRNCELFMPSTLNVIKNMSIGVQARGLALSGAEGRWLASVWL